MHIRKIEKTELNGMTLCHTQSQPEILYNGCVICFLSFDGDIEGVGTRLADLSAEEFMTFKTLIGMIEFESDKPDYAEIARLAMENIKATAERSISEFNNWDGVSNYDLDDIRRSVKEIEMINAKAEIRYD